MSDGKLEAALAARLHFDVFPIVENTKVPRIANWQNLATNDEQQIRKWWAEHPEDNVGGVTNTLIVVDIDPRNGGKTTLEALGDIQEFTKTLLSRTQSGGVHMIYAVPDGPVKGGTNKLGPGVDIKARGGYILLPGSTIDGRAYEWKEERPIAPAPAWIVQQCNAAKTRTDTAGKRIVEEDETAIEQAHAWIRERAPTATLGEIDDTTYKVAARLYDFGCSEQTVLELMHEWNESHCDGLGDLDRLPVVVESAGRNRDNPIGNRHRDAPGFEAVEIDESKAPAIGIPITKPTTEGMQLEGYFDAAAKALSSQAEPLIKGILDRAAMSILYGESNTGKTFVAVDMAFHVAASMAWAGKKTRHGAVVYVAAEGGVGVYKRLAALRKHYPDLPDVPFFIIKFPVDLLHGPEHGKALVALCREAAERSGQGLEMIVIDTLSRAMSGGDENSSTDMGAMVKSFDALREVTGAHLMVIHHSGKDRARGARGHSLLRAATDTEIEIERGKITVTKQRDMDGDFKQSFELKTISIGRDADGAHVTSCVVQLLTREAAEAGPMPVSRGLQELVNALDDALADHPEQRFGIGFVHQIKADQHPDHTFSRTTLVGNMTELVDAGWFSKPAPDQYVRRLVGKSRPR